MPDNKWEMTKKREGNSPLSDLDYKDIYLKKGDEIVGLHAIGYAGSYEYRLHNLDGSVERKTTDFMEMDKWGNKYDHNYKMLGGSFHIFDGSIEKTAKEFEKAGWVRFEREG